MFLDSESEAFRNSATKSALVSLQFSTCLTPAIWLPSVVRVHISHKADRGRGAQQKLRQCIAGHLPKRWERGKKKKNKALSGFHLISLHCDFSIWQRNKIIFVWSSAARASGYQEDGPIGNVQHGRQKQADIWWLARSAWGPAATDGNNGNADHVSDRIHKVKQVEIS